MCNNQMGQLDPSKVSIMADLNSGKLIDGVIMQCYYCRLYATV